MDVPRSGHFLLRAPHDTFVERKFRLDGVTLNASDLLTDKPIGIDYSFPQGTFTEPDYSHIMAPRRDNQPSTSAWFPNLDVPESYSFTPPNFGGDRRSSSQASTSSLSNSIATSGVTHGATLSIAPPPRMIESIMKKVANEMKNREESGSLDFSHIQVKLTSTGKEFDDSISFLNKLAAQLRSAKDGGSYQQL
ncbi:unnamed protein product [Caenorhabditis nigoni]